MTSDTLSALNALETSAAELSDSVDAFRTYFKEEAFTRRTLVKRKIRSIIGLLEDSLDAMRQCSDDLTPPVPTMIGPAKPPIPSPQLSVTSPQLSVTSQKQLPLASSFPTKSLPPPYSAGTMGELAPPVDYHAEAERLMGEAGMQNIEAVGRRPCGPGWSVFGGNDRYHYYLDRRIKELGSLRIIPQFIALLAKKKLACVIPNLICGLFSDYHFSVDDVDVLFDLWRFNTPGAETYNAKLFPLGSIVSRWGSVAQIRRAREVRSWIAASGKPGPEVPGYGRSIITHPQLGLRGFNCPSDVPGILKTSVSEAEFKTLLQEFGTLDVRAVIWHSSSDTFRERLEEVMRGVEPKELNKREDWADDLQLAGQMSIPDIKERVEYYLKLPPVY